MSGNAAWLFIAGAYGVGLLLLAGESLLLLLRSRRLSRGDQSEGPR